MSSWEQQKRELFQINLSEKLIKKGNNDLNSNNKIFRLFGNILTIGKGIFLVFFLKMKLIWKKKKIDTRKIYSFYTKRNISSSLFSLSIKMFYNFSILKI